MCSKEKDEILPMRMTLYSIVLITIGGLAGLYQSDSLMVLFLAGDVLLVLLFVMSWCLKGRVLAEFAKNPDIMDKGEFFLGTIKLTNLTRFPALHLVLWLDWENQMTGQRGREVLQGGCPPRAEAVLEFVWEGESCGETVFTLTKMETSDIFRLFKKRSKIGKKMSLLVLPQKEEVFFSLAAPAGGEEMRTYQQGDMVKYIHWKLSARMDELLVRHYQASALPKALLSLGLKPWPESEPEKAEDLMVKLSSVLLSLNQEGWEVRLLWNPSYAESEGKEGWTEYLVRSRQDYLEAMGRVMEALGQGRIKLPKKKGRFGAVLNLYEKNEEDQGKGIQGAADEEEIVLHLDFEGNLYLNGKKWSEEYQEHEGYEEK